MRAEEPTTTATPRARRRPPVPRRLGAVVAGLAAVGVAAWVAVTRWTTVAAGHPAYTWLLVALAVAGVVMLAWSTRARKRRDRGGWNRAVRAVPAIVLVLAAVAAGWLRPFPATTPDAVAGAGVADRAGRAGALDPDDPRSMIRQHHCRERPRADPRQFDDCHAVQGTRHYRSPHCVFRDPIDGPDLCNPKFP